MKTRKILYISGTRADYGLMTQTLCAIKKHPKLKIELAITGMHLMPEFGKTINEVKKDDFKLHKIEAIYKCDDKESMVNFMGNLIPKLVRIVKLIKPNMILLLGDRAEMLAGAIVGTYLTIPVVHIHGGETTSTVDETIRHTITKLSNVHLPATQKSARRIIKMGERAETVFTVGAPGLDDILMTKLLSKKEILKKYNLNLSKPILLITQHPVTMEIKEAASQIRETMEAVKELCYQAIIIYPNADAGGRVMIKIIEQYKKYPCIQIFKNIPRRDYLSLMKITSVMIGNSSSGIIEAPSFHLPVVNVGSRQAGRERAKNIIDVSCDKKQIQKAIKMAIYDQNFRKALKKYKNPYGDRKTGKRIADILSKIKIDKKLLQKQLTY